MDQKISIPGEGEVEGKYILNLCMGYGKQYLSLFVNSLTTHVINHFVNCMIELLLQMVNFELFYGQLFVLIKVCLPVVFIYY